MHVVILPLAEQDIVEIGRHLTDVAGNRVAEALTDRIFHTIDLLGDFPRIGTPRDDFRKGTRIASARKYLIFHTLTDDAVVILRVLHSARNVTPDMLP